MFIFFWRPGKVRPVGNILENTWSFDPKGLCFVIYILPFTNKKQATHFSTPVLAFSARETPVHDVVLLSGWSARLDSRQICQMVHVSPLWFFRKSFPPSGTDWIWNHSRLNRASANLNLALLCSTVLLCMAAGKWNITKRDSFGKTWESGMSNNSPLCGPVKYDVVKI